jgi:hypothetical protein
MSTSFGKMELVEFVKPGEEYIRGQEMVSRSQQYSDLADGNKFKEFIRNQDLLPKEWRTFMLVAPMPKRGEDFWILLWRDGEWRLGLRMTHFESHCRFVRLAK